MRGNVMRCKRALWTFARKGGPSTMSEKQILQNVQELADSINQNASVVRERLKRAGSGEPDAAIVASVAKYYDALLRLADE